jgi:hypothetical protein
MVRAHIVSYSALRTVPTLVAVLPGFEYYDGSCAHLCTIRKAHEIGHPDVNGTPVQIRVIDRDPDATEADHYDDMERARADFDSDEGEYLPTDDSERRIYLAMLGAANSNLIYSPRRHGNALKRQLGESDLEAAAFVPLRRKGFIARQDSPPLKRSNNRPAHVYRIKPRGADPEQWKYREVVITGSGANE